MVKACQIVVCSVLLIKFHSEFALVTAYTSHFQNKNTSVIIEYHNKLLGNSKSNYTLVCAPEKYVQEFCPSLYMHVCHQVQEWGGVNLDWGWTVQWASYQIRKISGCACAGDAGKISPANNFKGYR